MLCALRMETTNFFQTATQLSVLLKRSDLGMFELRGERYFLSPCLGNQMLMKLRGGKWNFLLPYFCPFYYFAASGRICNSKQTMLTMLVYYSKCKSEVKILLQI